MGLFSGEKQVFVDSVVYNLAGPPAQRPDYLEISLISALFNKERPPFGEALNKAYLRGPAIKFRSFGRWAQSSGYSDLVGQTSGTLSLPNSVDPVALTALIPAGAGQDVVLQTSKIGVADYTYWVDRFMLENHPDLINTAYTADFDKDTTSITVNFVGGGSTTFVAANYDISARYLYATYMLVEEAIEGDLTTGSTITVASSGDFPSTAGWTLIDTVSDSGSGYTSIEEIWQRTTYTGWSGSSAATTSLRETMHLFEVTDTATSEVTYTHRTDERIITDIMWSPPQVLIYRENSGNAGYDALFAASTNIGTFLPYIPVRVDNAAVSDSYYGDIFPQAKKALKRAVNGSYTEILDKVADNPSIGDIDYAFIVFGVSLNTQENSSKRYLYEFFQQVMLGQDLSGDDYQSWRANYDANKIIESSWVAWTAAQGDHENPLYGTSPPPQPVYPPMPLTEVRIRSSGRPQINYDMTVQWNSIRETTGSGLQHPGAVAGSLWFETLPRDVITDYVDVPGENGVEQVPVVTATNRVKLHWQVTNNSWRTLEFYGLAHRNLVYQGNSVDIMADDALADLDESGFIIPIHTSVLSAMPLRHSTQMSLSCAYLVFNCYKVVREKWYETAAFKIILIVIVVGVAMLTGYLDPNAIGLLGANAAVGAAAGLTGVTAAMVGAVANALAAVMVSQIISITATLVAGEKIGAIISVVMTVLMMSIVVAPGGMTMSVDFMAGLNKLMSAEGLLKLTSSLGNAYAQFIKVDTQDILERTQRVLEDYTVRSNELQTQMEQLVGGYSSFDPMSLTDGSDISFAEPVNSFLGRTLLTGSEIADLSTGLVTNFTTYSLNTELLT